VIASMTDVVLVEVTIDPDTQESIPVPDGACIEIVSYDTAPNNSCAGECGSPGPVPGSFPPCMCNGSGDSCPDACGAGICDDQAFCMANTEVVTADGLGLNIPDDGYDGSPGSMTCVDLDVMDDGVNVVVNVTLEIGIDHIAAGDLTMKVISPAGTIITVLSRPGINELADNGIDGIGDTSNLSIDWPITFFNIGATDAEDMGSTINANDSIVCMDDGLCEYAPNPGAAGGGDLSMLDAQSSVGTWQVCVADSEPLDGGVIDFVELTIDQVL
jgi:subtilisin-like proprotein convertase family protein